MAGLTWLNAPAQKPDDGYPLPNRLVLPEVVGGEIDAAESGSAAALEVRVAVRITQLLRVEANTFRCTFAALTFLQRCRGDAAAARRGYSVETSRGDAAAARRGYSVETSRGDAAAAQRGYSVETSRTPQAPRRRRRMVEESTRLDRPAGTFDLKLQWRDDTFNPVVEKKVPFSAIDWSRHFRPKWFLANCVEMHSLQSETPACFSIRPDVDTRAAIVRQTRLVSGTFFQPMALRRFPLDIQGLTLAIASEAPVGRVAFVDLDASSFDAGPFAPKLAEWIFLVRDAPNLPLADRTPHFRRVDTPQTGRGGAADATWIFRGDESWRRRGRDVGIR